MPIKDKIKGRRHQKKDSKPFISLNKIQKSLFEILVHNYISYIIYAFKISKDSLTKAGKKYKEYQNL